MVNSKSFALLHNSNWNWFINTTSSHEMSHTNCLNLDAYIMANVILEKMTTICLLMCILHLNLQTWHWILHEYMFQCHSEMKINIPTKVQTILESFLIVMCRWVLLGLGCLGNDRGEIEWLYAFGWQKFKTFNVFHQTCQED